MEELKFENEKLRDQIDQLQSVQNNGEELSIFQNKNPYNMPKLDLAKLRKQEEDSKNYVQKLEQSI